MRTETQAYPVLSQAESGGGCRGEVGAGGVEDLAAELVFAAIAVIEIGGLSLRYAAPEVLPHGTLGDGIPIIIVGIPGADFFIGI